MGSSIGMLMIVLAVALVVGLGILAFASRGGRGRSRLDQAAFRKRWQRIERLTAQGETGCQLAIIEADKLLDQALHQLGYPGETMGERLKDARHALRDNDRVWQAHKLRNRIAHEHDIRLNRPSTLQALRGLKGALKDLGAL